MSDATETATDGHRPRPRISSCRTIFEAGFSIGFRSSQDQSLALLGRAGLRVFVCDNLALSGSTFAFQRKHTSRLDLEAVVRTGFDRYLEHADALGTQVARLRQSDVTDVRAKEVIYDAVAQDVVPARLLPRIHGFYFRPRPSGSPRSTTSSTPSTRTA